MGGKLFRQHLAVARPKSKSLRQLLALCYNFWPRHEGGPEARTKRVTEPANNGVSTFDSTGRRAAEPFRTVELAKAGGVWGSRPLPKAEIAEREVLACGATMIVKCCVST